MIRACGRFAAVLVVGLGGAAAVGATMSATGPAEPVALATLDSKTPTIHHPPPAGTQDVETSSQRRAVADWSLIAQNAIVAVGKKFPGEAAVYMGIVHAAIYDVVVAIEGGYQAVCDHTNRTATHVGGGRGRRRHTSRARGTFPRSARRFE